MSGIGESAAGSAGGAVPAAGPSVVAGPIVGHGVDLVSIQRIADMLERHGDRFVDRCFTPAERAWAEAGGGLRAQRYAGRFAAKEAAAKALGTGIAAGLRWTDIEVLPDDRGAPHVSLAGAAATRATAMGTAAMTCSISHTGDLAMASVIASAG